MSTRVHEAGHIARLIGRLETEHSEAVYAVMGASQRCPTEIQQLRCTSMSSFKSQLAEISCRLENFSSTAAVAESLLYVAMATDDAVSKLRTESAVWDKLSQKSRHFLQSVRPLHALATVNESAYVISGDYSTVVDELTLLLPVPSRDVTLPRQLLCVDCETALFASVSGVSTIVSAQRAVGIQCALGHVFLRCGRLAAAERFYFLSNWSRMESRLNDASYYFRDSTSYRLYAGAVECPRRVFAAMSALVAQSTGCTTTDDVSRWYSACKEMLGGTDRVMESLIVRTDKTVAEARQRCVLEIVVYTVLICIQVCLV